MKNPILNTGSENVLKPFEEVNVDILKTMIEHARKRHGNNIGGARGLPFSKCFTAMDECLVFWYNDFENDSTHIIKYNTKTKSIVE